FSSPLPGALVSWAGDDASADPVDADFVPDGGVDACRICSGTAASSEAMVLVAARALLSTLVVLFIRFTVSAIAEAETRPARRRSSTASVNFVNGLEAVDDDDAAFSPYR